MNDPWVVVVIAIATLLLGAPVMSALGTWIQSRFGLLNKQVETDADIAKEARAQEYRTLMEFRQEQQRRMDNLHSKNVTLEDALRDTVRRCDDIERKYDELEREHRDLSEKVEHLNGELERVRGENVALKSRNAELERANYRLLAELDTLRRGAP